MFSKISTCSHYDGSVFTFSYLEYFLITIFHSSIKRKLKNQKKIRRRKIRTTRKREKTKFNYILIRHSLSLSRKRKAPNWFPIVFFISSHFALKPSYKTREIIELLSRDEFLYIYINKVELIT